MESSSYIKSSNTKRFVIEDSITKVTSDGEPHEMMTMIAGLSGVLAAVVILTVLIFLVTFKKSSNKHECDKCSESGHSSVTPGKRSLAISDDMADGQSQRSSIATIYESSSRTNQRSVSTPVLYQGGNFHQNINKAFESSELSLQNSLDRPKKQKRAHWQDEMEAQRETTIAIERY